MKSEMSEVGGPVEECRCAAWGLGTLQEVGRLVTEDVHGHGAGDEPHAAVDGRLEQIVDGGDAVRLEHRLHDRRAERGHAGDGAHEIGDGHGHGGIAEGRDLQLGVLLLMNDVQAVEGEEDAGLPTQRRRGGGQDEWWVGHVERALAGDQRDLLGPLCLLLSLLGEVGVDGLPDALLYLRVSGHLGRHRHPSSPACARKSRDAGPATCTCEHSMRPAVNAMTRDRSVLRWRLQCPTRC